MTRQEKLNEIERLKLRAAELHASIVPLRLQLEPLQSEWTDVTSRRMDLEREVTEVRQMPYWGPRSSKARDSIAEQIRQQFRSLSQSAREEMLRALGA